MGKKAESEITVLELVGKRRFASRIEYGGIQTGWDLSEFFVVLETNFLMDDFACLLKDYGKILKSIKRKKRGISEQQTELIKRVILSADKLIKHPVLKKILKYLKFKKMKYLRDDLVNQLNQMDEEISLLKKAAGI